MAYAGSTAGSTVSNPPILTQAALAGSTNQGSTSARGPQQWMYRSTHTQALVAATGFFTDGRRLGMRLGDSLLVHGATTFVVSFHTVQAVSTTGVTVSAGLLISSAS